MYQGKKFTGILYELSYDGTETLCYEKEYVDGFPHGNSRYWWGPGQLRSELIRHQKNNPCRRYAEWYINGILKELKESVNDTTTYHQKWNERGILTERWETLNEDDWDIFSPKASPIVNEKLHGTNTQWYDDGSIKEVHSYLKGKLVQHQKWDADGTLVKDWEIEPHDLIQLQGLRLPND
ncbi:MAG: hypothetical protein WBB28_17925 [Crinalium sp.]